VGELQLNEIGVISVESQRPLFFDSYGKNRSTGSFILIDPITNETVGAGMILQPQQSGARTGRVTAAEREAARGHGGQAVLLPAGSMELAWSLERRLFDQGCAVHVIHKAENLRQALRTAVEAGLVAVVVPESAEDREIVRGVVSTTRLTEVSPITSTADEAARAIVQRLEASDRLGRSQGPLTGGAGI
jgi:hypothetical protein